MTKIITLENLEESTGQEVFDQVVAHSRKQKEKSSAVDSQYGCEYRNKKGLACFGGCLMTDEEAHHIIELGLNKSSWGTLLQRNCVTFKHSHFIIEMQNIHDQIDVSKWEYQFMKLASEYELKYTKPVSSVL